MTDLVVAVTVKDSAGLTTSATSTITVTGAAATINVGVTTIQTNVDGGNANLLIAQPITLSQVGTIQSLSFYVKTIGGQLRLGLYSGATPTTLVAQTVAFTPVAGWNTQPVATQVSCPAGPYFLAYLPASNTLAFVNGPGSTSYYKSFTFGAMPATFPASPSTTPSNWSFYATFTIAPPPPPPPPGTPLGIGLSKVAVSNPPNANSVVAAVNVTISGGGVYPGQIILGGTDAGKFVLTNSGKLPCNLVVGSVDIAAGQYNITLTAN